MNKAFRIIVGALKSRINATQSMRSITPAVLQNINKYTYRNIENYVSNFRLALEAVSFLPSVRKNAILRHGIGNRTADCEVSKWASRATEITLPYNIEVLAYLQPMLHCVLHVHSLSVGALGSLLGLSWLYGL